MTRRVAIIGAAHRFPGTTSETFWRDLQAEKDLVTHVAEDRWSHEAYQHPDRRHPGTSVTFSAGSLGDISGFDAEFFGISPREATSMDPQQRMLLELAWEAMESAGVVPSTLRGSQCGVFVGIASMDYAYRIADDMAAIDASTATGNTSSIASNRLSYVFDLHGPSMSLDTACSSSLVAFHQACQAIRSGETDMALAGGISLHLHPYGFIIFSKASMLSATGRCQVFDADGNGYVRSEGAGLFLLKDYDKAMADGDHILAMVAGSSVNTDGHKSGLTVPNPSAQVALMRQAYAQAGISPDEIDYLEAHGTGTAVGDPIETRAIGEALAKHRKTPLPIGSVKSNVGHLETASGVAGLAKALYSLQHREVPATIGIRKLNPNIKFDEWNLEVVTEAHPLKPEGRLVIGVNSFGFGGANAHVILESAPQPASATEPHDATRPHGATEPRGALPLRLSARGEPALRAMAGDLAAWLQESDADLYDIAHSLHHHREHHRDGALLFADSKAEAARLLSTFADPDREDPAEVTLGQRLVDPSAPGFIYAGNGCQWARMGADLLAGSTIFAVAVDEVDALFQRYGDFSLRAELEGRNEGGRTGEGGSGEGPNAEERLAQTEIAQPTLFAVQVGLTRLLRHHGIAPAAVAGHSVGEVAAAWACGALSLEDAVKVIYFRSHHQGKTRGQGEMSAVALSEVEINEWLATGDYPGVHLAGINSSRGVTLAGDPAALTRLEQALTDAGTFAKRLPLDYAFHSPSMDPIEAGVIDSLRAITPREETLPYISTVTGERLTGRELGADYWWHNIRQPVRFDDAIKAMIDDGTRLFIEIGAHPILRRYLSDALRDRESDGQVLATLEREKPGAACMTRTIGQALLSGMPQDDTRWFPVAGQFVELPRYPWQRERYWLTGTAEGQKLLERDYEHPLLGYRLAQQDHTWESQLDTGRLPWLADHVVGEGAVFPGAGFVELALAAALHWRDVDLLDLEELEIHAPLLLDSQHGRRMRLHLAPKDGRLEIRSREPLGEGEWQLNAVARVMEQSRGFLLRRQAPPLPTREPDIHLAEHLAEAERLGLHYGPAFQAISRAWVEGDSILGAIEPPAAVRDTLEPLNLHPGILDSAFQLFIPLLAEEARRQGVDGDGMAFVPVRVGRLQLLTDAGVPTLAHARMLKHAPHSFTADFELFDADGQAVAVLSETRFKAIRLRRQHHQRFSYLDVALTPAPRHSSVDALDLGALYAAMPSLLDDFTRLTGRRYANEVDPLLDSLADAFAAQALRRLATTENTLSQARYRELTRTHLDGRRLLDQILAHLQAAGHLEADEHGWTLMDDEEAVAPEAIWQLLVRDYPDHFAPVQRLGRFGLHLAALLEGRVTAEDLGLNADVLANLTRQLPGAAGWQAIAGALRQALPSVLEGLPNGQRLRLLEAGAAAPALGERLCDLLDPDRCDYAILGVGEQAWHQVEQLQQRFPLIDIERLDGAAARGPQAQLALVSLEPGHCERNRRLLQATAQRLAPGAQLLVVGTQPSAWLDILLATPGLEDEGVLLQAMERDDVIAELAALGAGNIEQIPLEDDERGAYLVHAQWHQDPQQDLGSTLGESVETVSYQLIADDTGHSLAERLAAGLAARGHQARVTAAVDPIENGEGRPVTIIDLRQGEQRCEHAMQWAKCLEPLGEQASLWLITRGVAPMWQGLNRRLAPPVGARFIGRLDSGAQLTGGPTSRRSAEATQSPGGTESRDKSRSYNDLGTSPDPVAESRSYNHPVANSEVIPNLDAALWGFSRSLANESTGYAVRLLDLPSGELDDAVIEALLDELTAPDAETEIVLDGDGQRFATRLRTVPAPTAAAEPQPNERQAMTLGFELPGQLRHLRWTPIALPLPGPGEVEIDVQATGLNFRDVMYTLGLLSDEAIENGFAGPTLGLEFSGVVAAVGDGVGDGVEDLAVGDAVVGFGPASFSDRLVASRQAVAPVPEGVSFAAAATIPTTFFTVYYALKHLARLAPGEKILIHGAAGGVGIAAIQVAQWLGAEIHASVGSDEKRDFLRLLGVEHLYDSRSLTFGEEILEVTEGRGVDVVLNSLAGEAINQNLRALRPFGRFLELGKRDFYENTHIGLRPFRNNLSYFGIDSDQLMKELPELTGQLFGEMMALFQDGTLTPLPYTAFASQQVVEAFRYMQQARQIGKVVVTHEQAQAPAELRHKPGAGLSLPAEASYLITGGLGGFGLKTAQWLAKNGARHLVLVGRSGASSDEARAGVAELEAMGVEVVAAACDITDRQALEALLGECRATLPPLRGVVHAATVIDDGLIRNLDEARIRRVLAPKIDGARHLDALTRGADLDFFVMYSSATTLFGNPGQASYVAANHWLEALAAARRHQGLPATCLRWGAIEDVGFLARNTRTRDALQERLGGAALRSDDALRVMGQLLLGRDEQLGGPSLGVLELDWSALARFLPTAQSPRFNEIARQADDDGHNDDNGDNLAELFATLSPKELHTAVIDLLRAELAAILLIDEEKIDTQRSVYEMGFDSLMGVELMTAIESRIGINVPVMVLSEASTIDKLAGVLIQKLQHGGDEEEPDESDRFATLTSQHGAAELGQDARQIEGVQP
ncbi:MULTISPECIES: type I polyketide synthase [unclassified Halomonas]|uniref:type I polyketide synthase n=1 Tax=unclassified Halomonas TaxID=2609666 RepID=UPI002883C6F3|nr:MULTISPECIES: type I polyketide synthase [unclassified Halomonas]MDT0510283.1 type I polyketide synthase [Halomonas sp. LES1]MDT0590008.1 type I polyketide synthase [Halomonas sp. PAR8]